jgi:hypothetical protein
MLTDIVLATFHEKDSGTAFVVRENAPEMSRSRKIESLIVWIRGDFVATLAVMVSRDGANYVLHGPLRTDPATIDDIPLETRAVRVDCLSHASGIATVHLRAKSSPIAPKAFYLNPRQEPITVTLGSAPGEPPDVYGPVRPGGVVIAPEAYRDALAREGLKYFAPLGRE